MREIANFNAEDPFYDPKEKLAEDESFRAGTPPIYLQERLIAGVQEGDPAARQELVDTYEYLVWDIVTSEFATNIMDDRQDLFQTGRLALLKAAENFDNTKAKWFPSYAKAVVRSQLKRVLTKTNFDIALPQLVTEDLVHLRKLHSQGLKGEDLLKALAERLNRKNSQGKYNAPETVEGRMMRLLALDRALHHRPNEEVVPDEEEGESEPILETYPDQRDNPQQTVLQQYDAEAFHYVWSQLPREQQALLMLLHGVDSGGQSDDNPQPEIPSKKEVAELLGVSAVTISKWQEKALEYLRKGVKHYQRREIPEQGPAREVFLESPHLDLVKRGIKIINNYLLYRSISNILPLRNIRCIRKEFVSKMQEWPRPEDEFWFPEEWLELGYTPFLKKVLNSLDDKSEAVQMVQYLLSTSYNIYSAFAANVYEFEELQRLDAQWVNLTSKPQNNK